MPYKLTDSINLYEAEERAPIERGGNWDLQSQEHTAEEDGDIGDHVECLGAHQLVAEHTKTAQQSVRRKKKG